MLRHAYHSGELGCQGNTACVRVRRTPHLFAVIHTRTHVYALTLAQWRAPHLPSCPNHPAATSRFSQDRISDVELSKLLRWWQDSERGVADVSDDGVAGEGEALLKVWSGSAGGAREDDSRQGACSLAVPCSSALTCLQDKVRPKTLVVDGRGVQEEELRTILQVRQRQRNARSCL